MQKSYVYKITRIDDLEYIGITVNPKARFNAHTKSDRFSIGIKKYDILNECDTYEEAEELEEYYISKYDTYKNGLNLTYNGKGKSENAIFNTLGHVYSKESKAKMSKSAIMRGSNTTGFKHSDETKKKWSESRKGKVFGPTKLTAKDWADIYNCYINDTVEFDNEFISKHVKKTQKDLIGTLSFSDLKGGNGKPLTKETLYSNYLAEKYNVSQQAIRLVFKKNGIMGDIVKK